MRLYYNSATPPAETWIRVSAIVDFPSIVTRKDSYGLCIVVLRDFEGALYATWTARDLTEMKVTDDAGTPNTLFRGFLMNKKFHDRDLVLEIAGLGIMLYRQSFGSEEIMNYILATGFPKTLNANTQIDLQYRDSEGDFADFVWDVDKWILSDKDVGLIIKDMTTGFTEVEWDADGITVTGENGATAGNAASTVTFDDEDYYEATDTTLGGCDLVIEITDVEGGVIADTKKLKQIEVYYSFRMKITAGILAYNWGKVYLQIKKDGVWTNLTSVGATRYAGNHTTGWHQGLPDDLKEGSSGIVITEGGDDSELQKYFDKVVNDYDHLSGLRFKLEGDLKTDSSIVVYIDFVRVDISYHDDDVTSIMYPITDSGASWVKCAAVADWQAMGVTVDVDPFQIGENTNQIIEDALSQAGLNFWIESPTSFTKYMARKFKGKHCIEPLEAVIKLEGAHWIEDYINNRIVIIKPADYVDSGVDLTQANYEHEWEIEDQCNQVKYVYVWGKTSINEATQATTNIFAKAVSTTAPGEKSMQIVDDNIMTQPEAQIVADTQLALLETKRPSIRIPLDGVNIALQLGTYVGLTMARPTVGATDYNIRMTQRYRRGKTGIKTVVYCGMGETEWDEKLVREIQRLQLETHKALTDRLESTPYDVGIGGIVWDDIGGREAGAVAAVSAALAGDVSGTVAATVVGNDSHTHNTQYYTEAEVNALLGIGIANKRWIPCISEGAPVFDDIYVQVSYQNVGANNAVFNFGIPLPTIIGGTHNLVITNIKVGIAAADVDDFIDRMRLYAYSDHDSVSTLIDDGTNYDSAQEVVYNIADQTIGGTYERAMVLINCSNTDANALRISYVQVEYYYT